MGYDMARAIVYDPLRFSQVPWLLDSADLRAMGPPESTVEVGDSELAVSLYIPHPFGKETDAMLTVHAIAGNGNDGGTITLAISTVLYQQREERPKVKRTTKAYHIPDDNGANEPDED